MTGDDLIAAITNRGSLPPTANVWTPALILAAATEEMWAYLMPTLESTNQDYFTDFEDDPIVASQSIYLMPKRAAGATLRAVKYLDSNGVEGSPLAMIEVPDIGKYNITTANAPIGIYLTATEINLLPTPAAGTTGSIRKYYPRRPGTLVQDLINGSSQHTQVCTVASVAVGGGNTTITATANHSGFAANSTIDVTSFLSPYRMKFKDVTVTTMTPGSATIVCNGVDMTTGINAVVAGDFVTLSMNSYVPQGIPVEWHSLLELKVVSRVLESIGDYEGGGNAESKAQQIEKRLLSLSQPRSSGNPKKINAWR